MSAAMSVTEGSDRSDFSTETAAGPPAPVTRTRTGAAARSSRVMSTSPASFLQGRPGPDRPRRGLRLAVAGAERDRGAVPDHLERLGVAPFGEPGPVPGRRGDQPGLQVVAHRHLRAEGTDGLQLR